MDAKVLSEFKSLTRALLDAKERQHLQKIINCYKEDEDFVKLICGLKQVIVSAEQCQLLPFLRMFLLRKHRHLAHRFCDQEFTMQDERKVSVNGSKATESVAYSRQDFSNNSTLDGKKKNFVSTVVVRKMNESLGIGIRGGIDFGCGIFISDVQPESPAAKAGLRLGDQILFVNNISFESITANAAARFLASAFPAANDGNTSRLRIVFSRTGVIPAHRTNRERIAWFDVRSGATVFGASAVNEESQLVHVAPISPFLESHGACVEVLVNVHVTLSFAIRGGRDFGLGVFISALGNSEEDMDSAKKIDLRIGDEIVAVNGRDLRSLRHSQAVDYLRQQRHLSLTIRHIGKYPLYKEISSEVTWASTTAGSADSASITATKSVRNELPWETVVTIRRSTRPGSLCNGVKGVNDYPASKPITQSHRSLSFSLTKSSSGSLIIDAANSHQLRSDQMNSLRSSWSAVASSVSGMSGSDTPPRRRHTQLQRTPISTIHFDEVNNCSPYCDSCSIVQNTPNLKKSVNHKQENVFFAPRMPANFDDNGNKQGSSKECLDLANERVSKLCSNYESVSYSDEYKQQSDIQFSAKKFSTLRSSFKNDYQTKPPLTLDSARTSAHRVAFSDDEKCVQDNGNNHYVQGINNKAGSLLSDNPNQNNVSNWLSTDLAYSKGGVNRRPSVAVKGKQTTLVKLPKRPDTSLGLGVAGGGDSPDQCLRIDHALPDSIAGEAMKDGLLQPGCMLLAVDGQSLVGVSHEDAVGLIRRCFRDSSKPTLNLLVSTAELTS